MCDRGLPDNEAYLSPSDFYRLLQNNKTSKRELLLRYDAVFHLHTLAKTDPIKYDELSENSIRVENADQACEIDDNLTFAWGNHPHYFDFDSDRPFSEIVDEVIKYLCYFLDEDLFFDTDKFIIERPDLTALNPSHSKITTYRVGDDETIYSITEGDDLRYKYVHGEGEEYISGNKAVDLIKKDNNFLRKISFDRYSFTYNACFMTVDLYDNVDNVTVLTVRRKTKQKEQMPDGFVLVAPLQK